MNEGTTMTETAKGSSSNERGQCKTRVGLVVSDKMDKTVVVAVERLVRHPRYKKYIRKTKKLVAHDKDNQCGIGDTIRVKETRPLSKTKRWTVAEIIRKAE